MTDKREMADGVIAAFYEELREKYEGALAFCRGEVVTPEKSEDWRAGWHQAQRSWASRR